MENLKERVLKFLSKYPNRFFKKREIARRLNLSRSELELLSKILTELEQKGEIIRASRKRYAFRPRPNIATGILRVNQQGFGFVEIENSTLNMNIKQVFIPPRFIHTAIDGDKVSVLVFPRKRGPLYEGEIIDIIERGKKVIVGTLYRKRKLYFVVPDDKHIIHDLFISEKNVKEKKARIGDKVAVKITDWIDERLNPEGKIVEVIGRTGEHTTEMLAVAMSFGFPIRFPDDVLREAERIPDEIPEAEYKKRLDLRNLTCFTIDPEDAKDFDDAVSLEVLPDGKYRLGVHIADVSFYVKEGSKIDEEALRRGMSVYLVNEVVPMLPEKLSNEVCSLKPGVDRLAYTVFMIVNKRGKVESYSFHKSIIRSKRRFTYEEVQEIIEKGRGDFADVILEMHKLSKILLKKRLREGSIDFETPEVKFKLDDYGNPVEILKKERLDSHRLIEEFMLLANRTVAKHIGRLARKNSLPFIYRVHDYPDPDKLRNLADFVKRLGFTLKLDSNSIAKSLQKLLYEVRGTEFEYLVNDIAIRSMAKAIYSDKNIGHFGLGFKYYTHFTSPIRRYPDLVVHRLLYEYTEGAVSPGKISKLKRSLPEICSHVSEMEQRATDAEREAVKLKQIEYMSKHIGRIYEGIISGVAEFGFFVEVNEILVEGLVKVRDLDDDLYIYNESEYALIGKRTGKVYRLGDRVKVRVVRVDEVMREIDFVLVAKISA